MTILSRPRDPRASGRGATARPWRFALVGALAATFTTFAGGCPEPVDTLLACPVLAPGVHQALRFDETLVPVAQPDARVRSITDGELVAHSVYVPEGALLEASVVFPSGRVVVMAYGPRDAQGGLGSCYALTRASADGNTVRVSLDGRDDGAGEHIVLVTAYPGDRQADYRISIACKEGCDTGAPSCSPLRDSECHAAPCDEPGLDGKVGKGCSGVRCDGELVRDAAGCLTCECDPTALCGPDRAAGPWGTCILPACVCPDDAAAQPVCGADGRDYPSACAARCAGVAVAFASSCASQCPHLAVCDDPCFGRRAIDPSSPSSGCPSCDCAPLVPEDASSCAACPTYEAPVCGTDGVTYRNRCQAACAGAGVLYPAACVPDCRAAPEGCTLDCEWGLHLDPSADDCLTCACAAPPDYRCLPHGAPVCALIEPFASWTTVGSPCLALHLGAPTLADGPDYTRWGPCSDGLCDSIEGCPAGSHCLEHGPLAGRCLADAAPACGCAAVLDPVCGTDGLTHDNACVAHCAGQGVLHQGPCCAPDDDPPQCGAGQVARLDMTGCATSASACEVATEAQCPGGATAAPACTPDGAAVDGTACEAHFAGVVAATGWCAP